MKKGLFLGLGLGIVGATACGAQNVPNRNPYSPFFLDQSVFPNVICVPKDNATGGCRGITGGNALGTWDGANFVFNFNPNQLGPGFGGRVDLSQFGNPPRNGVGSDTAAVNAARSAASNGQVINLAPGILYLPGSISGGPANVVWKSEGPLYSQNGTSPLIKIGAYGDLVDSYLQGTYGTTKYYNQVDGNTLNTNSTLRVDRTLGIGSGAGGATPGAIFAQCTAPSGYAFTANFSCLKSVFNSYAKAGNMVALASTANRPVDALADGLGKRATDWSLYTENTDYTNQASSVSGSMTNEEDFYANGDGASRIGKQLMLSSMYNQVKSFVTFSGDTNVADPVVRNVSGITNVVKYQAVLADTGGAIPAGTYIVGIDLANKTVTLSQQPTSAVAQDKITPSIVPAGFANGYYLGTNDLTNGLSKTPLVGTGTTTSGVASIVSALPVVVGQQVQAKNIDGVATVIGVTAGSFTVDPDHLPSSSGTVPIYAITGAHVGNGLKVDMPYDNAAIDISSAKPNVDGAAGILMATGQTICLDTTCGNRISYSSATGGFISLVSGNMVGQQILTGGGTRIFSGSGDPIVASVFIGTIAFNTALDSFRVWNGSSWKTMQNSFSGTSGSFGGSALAAGSCSTATVSVPGVTPSMAVSVSPVTDPGDGFYWKGFVSAPDAVLVKVCASVAGTPNATPYNVRVLQ